MAHLDLLLTLSVALDLNHPLLALAGYLGAYHHSTGFASGLLFQVALELQKVRAPLSRCRSIHCWSSCRGRKRSGSGVLLQQVPLSRHEARVKPLARISRS